MGSDGKLKKDCFGIVVGGVVVGGIGVVMMFGVDIYESESMENE